MSRFILVAMMCSMTVAGCDRFPDNGLQIAAMLPPDSSCTFSSSQTTRLLGGLYDVGVGGSYVIAALVQSYLISNALEFQADQNNLQVDNLEITIVLPDGSLPALPGPNPYTVTTSAVLPANAAIGSFSEEVAAAVGIPEAYGPALAGLTQVVLEIRAGGTTFGGFSQRSAPFRFPVTICSGCLVKATCTTAEAEEQCFPGQDTFFACAAIVDPTAP